MPSKFSRSREDSIPAYMRRTIFQSPAPRATRIHKVSAPVGELLPQCTHATLFSRDRLAVLTLKGGRILFGESHRCTTHGSTGTLTRLTFSVPNQQDLLRSASRVVLGSLSSQVRPAQSLVPVKSDLVTAPRGGRQVWNV